MNIEYLWFTESGKLSLPRDLTRPPRNSSRRRGSRLWGLNFHFKSWWYPPVNLYICIEMVVFHGIKHGVWWDLPSGYVYSCYRKSPCFGKSNCKNGPFPIANSSFPRGSTCHLHLTDSLGRHREGIFSWQAKKLHEKAKTAGGRNSFGDFGVH